MLHGFGVWWGDILSLYALTGSIMALCRSWRPKPLLLIGIALYLIMIFPSLPFAGPFPGRHTTAAQVPGYLATGTAQALVVRRAKIAATIQHARSSWAGAYRVNAHAYLHQLQGLPLQIPANLGLMMIGLALFKVGFLSARSSEWRYRAVSLLSVVGFGPLRTANQLFLRHGYQKVAMSDLAEEAGLSRPTLYSAFSNKDAVFGALVE